MEGCEACLPTGRLCSIMICKQLDFMRTARGKNSTPQNKQNMTYWLAACRIHCEQ